ncbi:MAG: CoA transferase [Alphaproteobacteria bacterium]|nr:CoA transferase [Alphaproteobacteria bacterium]
MAEPLLATQLYAPPKPRGNISDHCAPHNAYRCAGDDDWMAIAARADEEWRRLCELAAALHRRSASILMRVCARCSISRPTRWRAFAAREH